MTSERIRELLAELDHELQSVSELDDDTRRLLARLNDDIDALAGSGEAPGIEQARQLESRFAADHPVAQRIVREIADLLAKMGI